MKYFIIFLFTIFASYIGLAQEEKAKMPNQAVIIQVTPKTLHYRPLISTEKRSPRRDPDVYYIDASYNIWRIGCASLLQVNAIRANPNFNGLPASFANYETWPYKDVFGREEGLWSLKVNRIINGKVHDGQAFSSDVNSWNYFGKMSITQL